MGRPLSFCVQEADVARLAELRYGHPHPRVQQRCWVLWLVSQGLPLQQASDLAGVSRISGWRYGSVYRERGLEGLLAEQWEGPESGLAPHAATLVLDNARYQYCQVVRSLAQQLEIERLFLPSYSPNLNLIERLWKFTKKSALRGRYYATFAEFRAAIDACLAHIDTTHRPSPATLMTHNFQTFDNVSLLAS